MRWLNILRLRVRTLLQRKQVEADLARELADHLESETEANLHAGMRPDDARDAARRAAGPVALFEEQYRDARGTRFFDTMTRDTRYAMRVLRHSPLFTLVAVGTLGLAIGANTAVFTFVNTVLLRPLPVSQPQQLVFLNPGKDFNVSYPNYRDFRDRNDVLSGLLAYRINPVDLSIGGGRNFRSWGYEATGNYFDLLGVHPLRGRFFHPEDDTARGAHPVIVLSYRCWQTRFAADPNITGRKIKINGFPFTVVGVAPREFIGTELIMVPDFWAPMSMEPQIEPGNEWLDSRAADNIWALGRLKPGVTQRQAEASLNRTASQLAREYPDINHGLTIHLTPPGLVGQAFRGPVTEFAAVLMAVAALVLLLACINLAGLSLARSADRRKEMAVRLSLGAGQRQILRQLLVESFLIAVAGAAAGLLLSVALTRLLSLWHPPFDIPANTTLISDVRVYLFTCLVSIATTFLFGLAPALQTIKVDLVPALKNETAFARFRRFTTRDLLVVTQIALSVLLLISSALVVRSLQNALRLPLGFNPEHAVSVSVDLSLQGYNEARGRVFQSALLEKAAGLPGIRAVGLINNVPLRLITNNDGITPEGRSALSKSNVSARMFNISSGYLEAAGTRLIAGRDVTLADRAHSKPVALVNENFVRQLLPGVNPLGKRFRQDLSDQAPLIEIVGVVEDGKYDSLSEAPQAAVFEPITQNYSGMTTLVARTPLAPEHAIHELRRTVAALDPDLPLFNVGSLEDQLAFPLLPARTAASVLGAFGILALVLAAIGVFALVAYSVVRRSREIGIRMALGARAGQVLSLVLRKTIILCAVGAAAGTLVTLAAAQLLSSLLYGISPRDPLTYQTALAAMALVAIAACWYPARKAVRIDPARTLRAE